MIDVTAISPAHGCIQCSECVGPCPICFPALHNHSASKLWSYGGQKCAQCGSTTIDHTESQCSINRQLKSNIGGEKSTSLEDTQ